MTLKRKKSDLAVFTVVLEIRTVPPVYSKDEASAIIADAGVSTPPTFLAVVWPSPRIINKSEDTALACESGVV